jgi:phage-related holin
MNFDIVAFVESLTIAHMAILIIGIELLETLSGIVRAWCEGKPIKSAITRESIKKKFDTWVYVFGLTIFALFVGQTSIAKMLLTFVLIPEVTSVVENIVRTFMEE